ncbi:hypothetical protein BABINDRAFT_104671 [Babjeviella inositovora NRRL Y-12698]|uniref:Mtf2-like C-terminal domain-containing protein n=1 Tax=Babjeviella inositovora NRRL Y-12698 TaxID=984486 RepID=A0A1E3QHB5_9ASCO|nr:uncharacterized protein BABINDRAFT_104671 [Babjeviella inositovora NRRL Y-12698]ODQ77081.1 hypothetical protein BABINDRAFT_104671 [Babjeviella inositovora NRRL Y-12698]
MFPAGYYFFFLQFLLYQYHRFTHLPIYIARHTTMIRANLRLLSRTRRQFHVAQLCRIDFPPAEKRASAAPDTDGINSVLDSILSEISLERAEHFQDDFTGDFAELKEDLRAIENTTFNSSEMNLLSKTAYRDTEFDITLDADSHKLSRQFSDDLFFSKGFDPLDTPVDSMWLDLKDPFATNQSANPFSFDLDPLADNEKSFKEREIFNSIFNDLLKEGKVPEVKQSEDRWQAVFDGASSSIGVVNRDIRNFPASAGSKFVGSGDRIYQGYDEKLRSELLKMKLTLLKSLAPTFKAMSRFATSDALLEFMDKAIVQTFLEAPKAEKLLLDKLLKENENLQKKGKTKVKEDTSKQTFEQIRAQSAENPTSPLVNDLTLPLLLTHGLKTLGFVFDSVDEATTVFNNLKQNLELYTYGVTAETYNEMLKISWMNYRSLYSVEELLKEMINNGIDINEDAHTIVFRILIDSYRQLKGDPASGIRPVWSEEDVSRTYAIRQHLGYR